MLFNLKIIDEGDGKNCFTCLWRAEECLLPEDMPRSRKMQPGYCCNHYVCDHKIQSRTDDDIAMEENNE